MLAISGIFCLDINAFLFILENNEFYGDGLFRDKCIHS
jgi:hypothetical protein